MTATTHTPLPTFDDFRSTLAGGSPTTAQLREHFAPVFAVIAEGSVSRERDRKLAHEAVDLLRAAGFTRVHLSWEQGGFNGTLVQLFELFIDLAEADSNLPQALHSHFLFTQIVANRDHGPITDWMLSETAAGKIFANAIVELPPHTGYRATTVSRTQETSNSAEKSSIGVLNGDKFYTTGALFADYLLVSAQDPLDDSRVLYAVSSDNAGVQRIDDWNGFGQRLTASGSTFLNNVPVHADRSMIIATPTGLLGYPLVWLILAATQVGIGRAALRDITTYVQGRRRTYGNATAETPAQDPLVHQVVGDVSAKVHAARYIVLGAAAELQAAFEAVQLEDDLESDTFLAAHTSANLAVGRSTVAISEQILAATSQIFEVGGASSLDAEKQLHRHWLNARVIGSQSPLIYRSRMIGDYHLNATTPPMSTTVRDSTVPQNAAGHTA